MKTRFDEQAKQLCQFNENLHEISMAVGAFDGEPTVDEWFNGDSIDFRRYVIRAAMIFTEVELVFEARGMDWDGEWLDGVEMFANSFVQNSSSAGNLSEEFIEKLAIEACEKWMKDFNNQR